MELIVIFQPKVCLPNINYGKSTVIRVYVIVVQSVVFSSHIELLVSHGVHVNKLLQFNMETSFHHISQNKISLHTLNKYLYVNSIFKVCI